MRAPFPDRQIEAVDHRLNEKPDGGPAPEMSKSLLQVDSCGGAVNGVSLDTTTVPERSSIMKLQYQTYWTNHTEPG